MHRPLRIKICGITQVDQATAIAQLGATALGFICVPQSPRYITPDQLQAITRQVQAETTAKTIGVFADAPLEQVAEVAAAAHLSGVQLHGQEPPEFCRQLRQMLPGIEIIKALRIRDLATLTQVEPFQSVVDWLLLDAYHPQLLGGTGQTLDWTWLSQFTPTCPWLLAGGLSPDNILQALHLLQPQGIDLSSGVELTPGIKDLQRVEQLFTHLGRLSPESTNGQPVEFR